MKSSFTPTLAETVPCPALFRANFFAGRRPLCQGPLPPQLAQRKVELFPGLWVLGWRGGSVGSGAAGQVPHPHRPGILIKRCSTGWTRLGLGGDLLGS